MPKTLVRRLRRRIAVFGKRRRALVVELAGPDGEDRALPEPFVNVHCGPDGGPFACPCCASRTLPARGQYELCPVCFWEDDGQDDHDADLVRLGPNGPLSLTQARANYVAFGACQAAFLEQVRSPTADEMPAG